MRWHPGSESWWLYKKRAGDRDTQTQAWSLALTLQEEAHRSPR